MKVEELLPILIGILEYGPKLIGTILVLIIGSWVIKALLAGVNRMMAKKDMDPSLESFVISLVGMILKILLFIQRTNYDWYRDDLIYRNTWSYRCGVVRNTPKTSQME